MLIWQVGAILQSSLMILVYVVANTVLYVQYKVASGEETAKTTLVSGEYVRLIMNYNDGEVVHGLAEEEEEEEEEANGGIGRRRQGRTRTGQAVGSENSDVAGDGGVVFGGRITGTGEERVIPAKLSNTGIGGEHGEEEGDHVLSSTIVFAKGFHCCNYLGFHKR
ncbi:hypothetical protein L1987_11135 [Smallanthus sonchifolius]|uniref:Uncharacterized protein n=1 Tax=Smallanthus sonchifolius TaxID=185202 RepID=A0ACB9JC65_9ASTR|nr:hypothetical protein L1987_11135 [Smallanthus sonchifolius]